MTIFNRHEATRAAGGELVDDLARRTVKEFVEQSRIPGMSFAVARPDGPCSRWRWGTQTWQRVDRPPSADQYPWFSMSKIATATAAMQLHATGRLMSTHRSRPTCPPTDRTGCTVTRPPGSC